jgi:CheY-like chemotaxis protein
MINVSVLVGTDRKLPELLVACGARVTTIDLAALKSLASGPAKQPDVIVVDVRERSSIPAELADVKRQHPSTGILIVLARLDGGLILEAMRAGASECLADPITQEELERAFARIAAQRPVPRRGDVFAVIGAKGGVGATTVAVNVASMLNKLRPSGTLLMDLHLTYGDAATFLGVEPRFSTLDALENMHRMDAAFLRSLVTQTKSALHVLPSSDHPVHTPVDVGRMRSLIELAATEFPYVVLDVPRSDAVALDARRGRQSGSGHGAQRGSHGWCPRAAVWAGARHRRDHPLRRGRRNRAEGCRARGRTSGIVCFPQQLRDRGGVAEHRAATGSRQSQQIIQRVHVVRQPARRIACRSSGT